MRSSQPPFNLIPFYLGGSGETREAGANAKQSQHVFDITLTAFGNCRGHAKIVKKKNEKGVSFFHSRNL